MVCVASATTPTSPPVSVAPSYSSTSALVELSVVFILDAQPSADDDVRYERAIAGCKSAADQLSHALQREEAYSGIVSLHMGSVTVQTVWVDTRLPVAKRRVLVTP